MANRKGQDSDKTPDGSDAWDAEAGPMADQILEHIGTPVVVLDLEGRILQFNEACRSLTGYERADVVGRHVWDFLILPEEIEAARAVFDKTRSGDVPTHFVSYWLTKAGNRRLLRWSSSRIRLPSGKELHILATGIDITDVAAAENALADREAYLRSIVDTSPDSIIAIDAAGIVRSFSPAAESTFGYKAQEIIGENIRVLMPEPYNSKHPDYLKRYLDTGIAHIVGRKRVVSARRRDGTLFPIRLSVGEFTQHDRLYFVGFIEDLSLEEDARQRLGEMQKDLDRFSRVSALGEMAATIAHELNQPLTAAAAFGEAADLLLEQQGAGKDAPVRRELRRTLAEVHRTAEIIRNVREFIRKGAPDVRPHDINVLVEDALSFVFAGSPPDGLEVEIELAPDLPSVAVDRVQFQQVIVNLVRNALETMDGGDLRRLGVSTALKADYVEISVADTGPGVDPAIEGRLFEPFATNKKDGMGLGLAIAKTIVERYSGHLTVRPNAPLGTVITVRLPVEQVEPP